MKIQEKMMVSSNELLFKIKICIVLAEESLCIDAVHDFVHLYKGPWWTD